MKRKRIGVFTFDREKANKLTCELSKKYGEIIRIESQKEYYDIYFSNGTEISWIRPYLMAKGQKVHIAYIDSEIKDWDTIEVVNGTCIGGDANLIKF